MSLLSNIWLDINVTQSNVAEILGQFTFSKSASYVSITVL